MGYFVNEGRQARVSEHILIAQAIAKFRANADELALSIRAADVSGFAIKILHVRNAA
ncbi:hypothetical protein BSLA_01f0457 [Burkholderia stabilis]|nr:hypothetical protein BSLA_01f0457 [Burkholderia stabilis]